MEINQNKYKDHICEGDMIKLITWNTKSLLKGNFKFSEVWKVVADKVGTICGRCQEWNLRQRPLNWELGNLGNTENQMEKIQIKETVIKETLKFKKKTQISLSREKINVSWAAKQMKEWSRVKFKSAHVGFYESWQGDWVLFLECKSWPSDKG